MATTQRHPGHLTAGIEGLQGHPRSFSGFLADWQPRLMPSGSRFEVIRRGGRRPGREATRFQGRRPALEAAWMPPCLNADRTSAKPAREILGTWCDTWAAGGCGTPRADAGGLLRGRETLLLLHRHPTEFGRSTNDGGSSWRWETWRSQDGHRRLCNKRCVFRTADLLVALT